MKEENLDLPNDMLTLFLKEKSKFLDLNCKVREVRNLLPKNFKIDLKVSF